MGGSSSSGTQPIDQAVGQQKRSELGDTGGEETKKRGRKKRGDEVVLVETKSNGNGNGNGKPKAKAKAKAKAQADELDALKIIDIINNRPETEVPPSNVKGVKKNIVKQKQLAPSIIGIQKVREELINARNKNNLSDTDWSEYLKLYDDFVAAKGDKTTKKEKLNGLRALYKKSIYRK